MSMSPIFSFQACPTDVYLTSRPIILLPGCAQYWKPVVVPGFLYEDSQANLCTIVEKKKEKEKEKTN